jgi:uncharacterized membrane protein
MRDLMKHLVAYFLRGLLVLVPLSVTLAVLWWAFVKVDRWLGLPFPGTGLLLIVGSVTLVGVLASTFVTRTVFELLDKLFERLPLVKLVYSSVRDLTNAFVGERKGFDQPVLVRALPGSETWLVGFATRDSLEALDLPGHVAVYVPQAYALCGLVALFPRDQVRALAVKPADIMAFAVSGGVSGVR